MYLVYPKLLIKKNTFLANDQGQPRFIVVKKKNTNSKKKAMTISYVFI